MSVSVVLSQFEALVTRMESVGSKLCTKRIRSTRDQRDEFQNLHKRLKATLATFDTGIQRLLAIGTPDEDDIHLADRVRSAKDFGSITSPILTTLKRNMALIFIGPKTSNLDSTQVKTRHKQTEMRCETLLSQHGHVILMWAMALPPSVWKTSGGMTDKTFQFLIEDLEDQRLDHISPQILEIVQSLAEEEPLNTSDSFKVFVESMSKSPQEDTVEMQPPLKRRCTGATSSNEFEAAGFGESELRVDSANNGLHVNQHTDSIPKIQNGRRKQ